MHLPEKHDPRWRELVGGRHPYALQSLPARMLVARLRLQTLRGDEVVMQEAIAAAWDFFERNEATTQADVAAIFGAPDAR